MNVIGSNIEIRHEQGFDLYVLGSQDAEVVVVPELGAKVISLTNLRSGREWMWHPPGGRKLFRNRPSDDFSASPLVGMDECLPTIAPCLWQGRQLPDHGELWNLPWQVDGFAKANGVLKTSVTMKASPFDIERTVELYENEIRFTYLLRNRSPRNEHYLWAMHPLLRLHPGDQLELPPSTRKLLQDESWLDNLATARPAVDCAKLFARPVTEGFAAIHNRDTGDRLEFAWSPAQNNTLGVWLNRGGWHGHEHFALEPTNSDADTLTLAAARNCCGTVAALESVTWQVDLRVGS